MKKTIQLLLAVQFVAALLFAQGTAGLAIGGSRGEQFYHVSALGEGGYLLVGSTDSEDAAESVPVQHSRWQTTSEAPSRVDRDFGARVTYLQGSPALDPFYIEEVFVPTKKIVFASFAIGSLLKLGAREAAETVAAKGGANAAEYTFTKSAGKHLTEIVKRGENAGQLARPYMKSPLTIQEIMSTGKGIPDATFKGGMNWRVPGTFRGSQGTWQLGINPQANVIYHFNFVH